MDEKEMYEKLKAASIARIDVKSNSVHSSLGLTDKRAIELKAKGTEIFDNGDVDADLFLGAIKASESIEEALFLHYILTRAIHKAEMIRLKAEVIVLTKIAGRGEPPFAG